MKSIKGILITFEGTEGAGKSTLMKSLEVRLKKLGLKVIQTREPGGSALAEKIRQLILENKMNSWTEVFLYEAARSEHLTQTILPALKKGAIVLCDRFTDSTLAYQAFARGLPWEKIRLLNHLATQGIQPGLTVFLDIDPALGLKRATQKNRFEKEGVEFQTQVRLGFKKARKADPKRWLTLDSRKGNPEKLSEKVLKEIFTRFGRNL